MNRKTSGHKRKGLGLLLVAPLAEIGDIYYSHYFPFPIMGRHEGSAEIKRWQLFFSCICLPYDPYRDASSYTILYMPLYVDASSTPWCLCGANWSPNVQLRLYCFLLGVWL